MTVTISQQTDALLAAHAERTGQTKDALAEAKEDFADCCRAIEAGLAEVQGGRTVSLEEARRRLGR